MAMPNILGKKYVLDVLREEPLWKIGHEIVFDATLAQKWKFTLRKEDACPPYRYSLKGIKTGTCETWIRRYKSADDAFLHVVNHLNENTNVKDRYACLEDWLLSS